VRAQAQRNIEFVIAAVSGRDGRTGGRHKQGDEQQSASSHFAG
jgi:hypothetical protein